MDSSQATTIIIDEKAPSSTVEEVEEEEQQQQQQNDNNIIVEVLPPSYDFSVHDCPPPPNYIHSTRLMYQNEPYISGFDTMDWRDTTENRQNDYSSDIWSEINELPFRHRLFYYLQSWATIIYDCRFIFFVLAVCFSLALMFIIFALILLPDHYQFTNNS